MSTKDESKPVQRFSWKKAGASLTETEKNRICCLLLTCFEQIKPTGEDMELAATQFGAAKGGFAKMYQTTIKKLREANAYIIEGENVDDIPEPTFAAKTPKKGAAASKRKAGEANGDGDEAKSPTKKPRANKNDDAKVKAEDDEEIGEGDGPKSPAKKPRVTKKKDAVTGTKVKAEDVGENGEGDGSKSPTKKPRAPKKKDDVQPKADEGEAAAGAKDDVEV